MSAPPNAVDPATDERLVIRLEAEELRQKSHVFVLWFTAITGWFSMLLLAFLTTLPSHLVSYYVFMFLGTLISTLLRRRYPIIARLVLLAALSGAYFSAVLFYPQSGVRYFGVLVVLACVSMMPSSVAFIESFVLCAGLAYLEVFVPEVAVGWLSMAGAGVLILLSAVLGGLSNYQRDLALGWASNSTSRAMRLADQLRERQQVLNRTLRAMDEANERLVLMNQRLDEARRTADEARQVKARFAANISHELRTPLNLILGFAEVMYKTPYAYPGLVLTSEYLLDLGAVYRNAQHLQRLVDDILDLAQLDAGKVVVEWQEVDLVELAHEAVETVQNLATVRGLELKTDIAADLPHLRSDRTRVKQVLLNLLSNAARYTQRGTITVNVWQENQEVL